MNNVTLAHIGGDLVLIGGVAFYFHRKTNALQEEINSLKKTNKELSDAVEDLQEGMQQLGAMVMQMQRGGGGMPAPPAAVPAPMQTAQTPVTTHTPARPRRPARPKPAARALPTNARRRPPPSNDSDDSGEDTLDDRYLDQELQNEYVRLEQERGGKPQVQCEGEVCQLVSD